MGPDQSNLRTGLRRLHQIPLDLSVVVVLSVVGTFVVISPQTDGSWLRTLLGLPLVFFLPGYALSTALLPASSAAADSTTETRPLVDGIERVVLSVVGSIAVGPILSIGLNYTSWGIHRDSVTIAIGSFTVLAAIVGAYRRQYASGSRTASVLHWRTFVSRTNLSPFDGDGNWLLTVLVVVSLLAAGVTTVHSVVGPDRGETYTEFYLLTEDGNQRIADEYPDDLVSGENQSMVVGIHNREQRMERYSVVVVLERPDDGGGTTVGERQELRRFHTRLAPNESTETQLGFTPELVGERLRLGFLLYRDGVPSTPTPENAYRDVYLWVNVEQGATTEAIGCDSSASAVGA